MTLAQAQLLFHQDAEEEKSNSPFFYTFPSRFIHQLATNHDYFVHQKQYFNQLRFKANKCLIVCQSRTCQI